MSGGVDSSVAAALLVQAGYDCAGVSMELLGKCEDAEVVCSQLHIPHFSLDLHEEFTQRVIEPFATGYASGSTPNPCISCNRHLKFGLLLQWANQEGFDSLATGHYARILDGRLLRAKDREKDQSYVLYALSEEQLRMLRFPLGEFSKDEVRQLALDMGLASANKPESQDICFIPEGDYASFIEDYLQQNAPEKLPGPGNIIAVDGTVVGTHGGIHHFTIGQRRGLGVVGAEPYYVKDINADSASVFISTNEERGGHTALINEVNIISPGTLTDGQSLTAKHRYRGREHPAKFFLQSDNTIKIVFEDMQPDLTKGQALVLYDEDCVLGGGTIVGTL